MLQQTQIIAYTETVMKVTLSLRWNEDKAGTEV
jgi:hypothetical protein